jgi:hypothetical protein
VAVGVIILGMIKGPAYDIGKEIHRAKLGICDFSNWREAIIGFVAIALILVVLWVFRIVA